MWSKQSLCVVSRVALKAGELSGAMDEILEVERRSSGRGLHMMSGKIKKGKRKWIMVPSSGHNSRKQGEEGVIYREDN